MSPVANLSRYPALTYDDFVSRIAAYDVRETRVFTNCRQENEMSASHPR
jgi:hypothetical protein